MACFRGIACMPCLARGDEGEQSKGYLLDSLALGTGCGSNSGDLHQGEDQAAVAAREPPHASPRTLPRSAKTSPRAVAAEGADGGSAAPFSARSGSASARGSAACRAGGDGAEGQRAARPLSPKVLLARERLRASVHKPASVAELIEHWKKDTEVPVIEGFA
mmetsp:Transcript_36527/g.73633  ORF Transcript_36527/g.73633 Transcript_36527/m.73633 type:complete len:162 (+) Transcript_36527:71-556(+)